ncbi:unnamed protein product [Haemonchus placei]|uniref:Uncharacterized protein n=1 Tax=Haemonchus placei TaxID=6290 RepID=A0A0N4XA93_HAEPC|nr:unnamed protein product [Haemonchus placei]
MKEGFCAVGREISAGRKYSGKDDGGGSLMWQRDGERRSITATGESVGRRVGGCDGTMAAFSRRRWRQQTLPAQAARGEQPTASKHLVSL